MHMNRLAFPIASLAVLVATVSGATLHQQFDVYGRSEALKTAGAKLSKGLPETVGSWRMAAEPELESEVVGMLRCSGYVNRVYLNEQTGDRISVAVLVGPAGTITVHTPEICYSSTHFKAEGPRERIEIKDRAGNQHSLWSVRFRSTKVNGGHLKVVYGWSEGGEWQATDRPRFTHSGKTHLYKLQAAITDNERTTAEVDACEDFLSQFAAQLQANLTP
jgi:hypothetical protein